MTVRRLSGLLLALCPTLCAAQVVAPAADPPEIDGQLDDACWQSGPWTSGFRVLSQVDRVATPQTHFKVRHAAGRLIFGVKADEPNIAGLKNTVTQRDGKVYNDDSLEIMLDPTGEQVEHFHFAVNPAGTIYDAQVRQGGQVMTAEWDGDVEVAAARATDSWSIELAVPLADLGLRKASLGAWGVNVARERQASGTTELSTFAPLTGGFHQPSQFASLQLEGAALERYLWEVRQPYEQRVVESPAGLAFEATTFLTNQTDKFRFLVLEGVLRMASGGVTQQRVTRGLDAGQGQAVGLRVPVAEQGPGVLALRILDRATGELWAAHQVPVNIAYTPLAIRIERPSYRQTIYATQQLDTVAGQVVSGLTADQMVGGRLTVALLDGERTVAETGSLAELAVETPFVLPVRDLPIGLFTLRATFVSGERTHVATTPLRKVGPSPNEVRVDEHQVVRVNGEPFLAFGWFSTSANDYASSRAEGCNAFVDYGAQWRKLPEQIEFLDRVHEAGLRVAFYPYPNPQMVATAQWAKPLSDEEAALLRERVRALKDHPAVLAWYLADEPELRPALPARLEAIRELIADEDPYHPCIMLNDTIAGIHKYAGGGEILMPDPYPLFIKGGRAAREISRTAAFMEAVQQSAAGWRAAWVTPQGFNYGDYGRLNNRVPNLAELRNQWHQAICWRTTGALWYTYGQRGNYPELSIGMRFLTAETRALEPWILAVATDRSLIATPAASGLLATWRQTAAGQCVFAVNTATEARDAGIELPPGAPETWYVVSEGRSLKAVNGRLSDRFEPYATHVYSTVEALATRWSLADAEAQIDAANAARSKPGNLAFEDRGTTVEVSSRSTYGSTPDRVLDGITQGMRWRDGTPDKYPDWLLVRFAQPATVGRVVVWSPDIETAAVEAADGDGWQPLGELRRIDDGRLEAVFGGRPVAALRVLVTASTGRDVTITEVEAYAP